MTVDQTQTFLFQQAVVRKLFSLEEQYEKAKGREKMSLAQKVRHTKNKIQKLKEEK